MILVFGEGIIERLPMHSVLHNEDNPFRRVFIGTVGAILDDFDIYDSMEGVYLQSATGVYLDAHGEDLGVKRRLDEGDDDYRARLTYEVLGYLTVNYLVTVYGLTLYSYVEDFDPSDNTLVSDNPYASTEYMSIASEDIQQILEGKFIVDGGITWLSL